MSQIDDGARLLRRLASEAFEVKIAYWVQMAEIEQMQFRIVTDTLVTDGLTKIFTRLQASLAQLPELVLTLADIGVSEGKDLFNKGILNIRERYAGRTGVKLGAGLVGDQMIEWAYIYPPKSPFPDDQSPTITEDLFKHLFELISRGPGIFPPSHVALRDGRSFDGVPVAFSMGIQQASIVQFQVASEPLPRVVAAQEILSIL